jgi:hypothetical protein
VKEGRRLDAFWGYCFARFVCLIGCVLDVSCNREGGTWLCWTSWIKIRVNIFRMGRKERSNAESEESIVFVVAAVVASLTLC